MGPDPLLANALPPKPAVQLLGLQEALPLPALFLGLINYLEENLTTSVGVDLVELILHVSHGPSPLLANIALLSLSQLHVQEALPCLALIFLTN